MHLSHPARSTRSALPLGAPLCPSARLPSAAPLRPSRSALPSATPPAPQPLPALCRSAVPQPPPVLSRRLSSAAPLRPSPPSCPQPPPAFSRFAAPQHPALPSAAPLCPSARPALSQRLMSTPAAPIPDCLLPLPAEKLLKNTEKTVSDYVPIVLTFASL